MIRRVFLIATAVELALLIVSGVVLFFVYQPSAAQAWDGLNATPRWVATATRTTHSMVSQVLLPTTIATAIVVASSAARRAPVIAAGIALVLVAAAASFTGYLLPWDQLALWAVTVGSNMNGFVPLFGDEVRFVLIDGVEIGPDTLLRWLAVHALVLTPLATGLLFVLWRRRPRVASVG